MYSHIYYTLKIALEHRAWWKWVPTCQFFLIPQNEYSDHRISLHHMQHTATQRSLAQSQSWAKGPLFSAGVYSEVAFESCLLSMMITHFFDTQNSSNSNVCKISCWISVKSNVPVGASNKVILRLCDAVDQPPANTCANLCPDHLKSERKLPRFCWSQPKMNSGIISRRVNSCVLKQLFWRRFGH